MLSSNQHVPGVIDDRPTVTFPITALACYSATNTYQISAAAVWRSNAITSICFGLCKPAVQQIHNRSTRCVRSVLWMMSRRSRLHMLAGKSRHNRERKCADTVGTTWSMVDAFERQNGLLIHHICRSLISYLCCMFPGFFNYVHMHRQENFRKFCICLLYGFLSLLSFKRNNFGSLSWSLLMLKC